MVPECRGQPRVAEGISDLAGVGEAWILLFNPPP